MANIHHINELLDKLTKEQLGTFIKDRVYEIDNQYYSEPYEHFVAVISTKYSNEYLQDIIKTPPVINNLYMTMIEDESESINRDSIILTNYKPDEDYYIYNGTDKKAKSIISFMKKYSFDEKFNSLLDSTLARINFEKENFDEFLLLENGEYPDNYERKHFMIRKFYQVWEIYKCLSVEDKDRFFEKIIKKHFCNINWRTMSRLYDPEDKEFVEKFGNWIDKEFESKFHPKFK